MHRGPPRVQEPVHVRRRPVASRVRPRALARRRRVRRRPRSRAAPLPQGTLPAACGGEGRRVSTRRRHPGAGASPANNGDDAATEAGSGRTESEPRAGELRGGRIGRRGRPSRGRGASNLPRRAEATITNGSSANVRHRRGSGVAGARDGRWEEYRARPKRRQRRGARGARPPPRPALAPRTAAAWAPPEPQRVRQHPLPA